MAERDFHINEMQSAKKIILAKHPNLKVKMMLAKILHSGKVEIDETE